MFTRNLPYVSKHVRNACLEHRTLNACLENVLFTCVYGKHAFENTWLTHVYMWNMRLKTHGKRMFMVTICLRTYGKHMFINRMVNICLDDGCFTSSCRSDAYSGYEIMIIRIELQP